ncbi:MAG: hypothetical protein IPH04_02695 [Saprospirales bacterium]|nr:hypothetical protein [Saprospirales bacterium]
MTYSSATLYGAAGSPAEYILRLSGERNTRKVEEIWMQGKQISQFLKPATLPQTPKIYIIQKALEILYIGYTRQSISSRLRFGLDPRHQVNYHGYSWMNRDEVNLRVWVFQSFTENEKENEELKRAVQNLEAELVYFVRNHTGQWPADQREIHFGNEHREEVERWVKIITENLK